MARANVQIAHDPSETVANQNLASAQSANCVGCRTVAVAMQVILIEGDPTDFEPANAAAAVNGNCDTCQTYAYAFQYVVQPGRVVYLSGDAQQQLLALRQQVDAVAGDTSLSYPDMKAQLEPIFAQVVQTVSQDLEAAGANGDGQAIEASQAA